MVKKLSFFLVVSLFALDVKSQQPAYPRTTGYMSITAPLITLNKEATVYNFSKGTANISFPCGINVLKSDKLGFSFELTPTINITDSTSKVSNVLFHPGIMFRYPHGFTFISRLAFETSGRYGFTPVLNKVIIRRKMNNYFLAIPIPFRFGNGRPTSVGIGLHIGVTF